MAKPRQTSAGKWEVALRHPALPGGRKYFTFDTEALAIAYNEQWTLLKLAGLQPPQELLRPAGKSPILSQLIRAWANSGLAAPSQQSPLGSLVSEVGAVKLEDCTYAWLSAYVQRLKVKNNLTPGTIKHRIQGLGRSIDEYLRNHPKVVFSNPVRLLPKGYSVYSPVDKKLCEAAGLEVREDISRDRRLHPGEEDRIIAALSGRQRDGKPRALSLPGGSATLTMFIVILYSGMRLREAYTLKRSQIDLDSKVIRVQSTKQRMGKVVFRDVPMRPEIHRALVHYLSTKAMLPGANLFPVMDEAKTLKQATQLMSDRFRIAFAYADCQDLREHDLRHEATCRWLEMKDDRGNWMWRIEETNRIMGWSSNSTMAHRYASFRGSDMAQRMWPVALAATGGEA